MPQTSVADKMTSGFAGNLTNHEIGNQYDSVVNKEATAIPLGCGVVYDSDGCGKLPGGSTDAFLGVAYDDFSLTTDDNGAYAQNKAVPLVRKGEVQVVVEDSPDPTKAVYLRYTANGAGKTVGQFRTDNDGGKAFQLSNCAWRETVTGPGYARLAINIP